MWRFARGSAACGGGAESVGRGRGGKHAERHQAERHQHHGGDAAAHLFGHVDWRGQTALHVAAARGFVHVVHKVLELEAPPRLACL